ncbi:MAG: hypothetical protein Q7O12_05660 [Deltaproteobacteria bacterium]|nr:hypothetical protein [Deltaproteobacteria bacterium]
MGIQRIENKLRKKRLAMQEKRKEVISERLKTILVQKGKCEERSCEHKLTCPYYRKTPKDKLLKDLVNFLPNQKKAGIFPTMPTDQWMVLHGTKCQDDNWVDTPKPSVRECHKPIPKE